MDYLISTSHFEDRIWFRNDEDFKTGMNYTALASLNTRIAILCFVLMSNHVHFVVSGTEKVCKDFLDKFKQLYASYLRHKYGMTKFLKHNACDIRPLQGEEAHERAIAYVMMNPVSANICLEATGYPWGSGLCYFNLSLPEGTGLIGMSRRKRIQLLHSELPVNDNWKISSKGYILPQSFIEINSVERVFRTPGRMHYFLTTSSKARLRTESEPAMLPSFRDQTIVAAIPDICISLFGKHSPEELSQAQYGRFISELHRRFSSDIQQLARIIGLPQETLADILDKG